MQITRLPKGHTHADIDAVFGNIWTAVRAIHLLTQESWKLAIEKILAGENRTRKVFVRDIYCVIDFEKLFNGAYGEMSRYDSVVCNYDVLFNVKNFVDIRKKILHSTSSLSLKLTGRLIFPVAQK